MIVYSEEKEDLINYIHNDIEEIENIKTLYQNKVKVFENYLISLNEIIQKEEVVEEISTFIELLHTTEDNLKYFRKQIEESKRKIEILSDIENDINRMNKNSFKKKIKRYNRSYNTFKKELIEHSIVEEQLKLLYIEKNIFTETVTNNSNDDFVKIENDELKEEKINENIIEDNNTLLISEIQNKVILPYKVSELKEILISDENDYSDMQTIIDEKYTVPLIYYKYASISRYREALILMRKKEKASLFDSLDLALELMRNRYVHPAVITACKDLDQLDIYLDCLETNELNDFPFFKIKYELYPMKVKTKEFDFEDVTPKKNILGFFRKNMSKSLKDND